MRRVPAILFVLLILNSIILCGCESSPSQLPGEKPITKLVSSFEGGYLYQVSHMPVAQLNGSYRQMGRQYGGLLGDRIKKFLAEFENTIIWHTGLSARNIEEKADKVYNTYPKNIKAIFKGMEETSGVSLKKLKQLDTALLWGCTSQQDQTSCTNVVPWGYKTLDWHLILGRNLAMPGSFKRCNEALAFIVYNPDDGSHSIATIVYAGQVSSMQVLNDAGIFVGANSLIVPNENIDSNSGAFLGNDMLTWLLKCGDLDELTPLACEARLFGPAILTIANENGAISIERTADDFRKVAPTQKCYVVTADNFVDPTWGSPAPPGPYLMSPGMGDQASLIQGSEQRYNNMVALGEKYANKWSLKEIFTTLDTDVNEGGAFTSSVTVQVAYIPSSHSFFMRAPVRQGQWVNIYLNKLLKGIEKQA